MSRVAHCTNCGRETKRPYGVAAFPGVVGCSGQSYYARVDEHGHRCYACAVDEAVRRTVAS